MKYLLDTCALSELVKSAPDARVIDWFAARKPHELYISAMTWGELQRGVGRLPESKRRAELTSWLEQLGAGFEGRILAFDQSVADAWAQMTVQADVQGKPMSAFDSIIAATARAYQCQLVTRNVRDFANAGVELINPWQA
ncbi:type II toxin-antitoxin system VapC family toxin [Curvibacter sp. CHRR-16]|uniref:type II toxin-antitoxin system VapC family toxin n=1 Tax=Curvibacter sp. CHRR-16 TaxID=2835872 RepID=UPI001BDB57EA|nr:type II toxin-antitoxin system VapC family toxin [Curvibacter sp. CHRR-16]MBT0569688.1 type II toxin-antitoxin system VapC family toxin [Curvibacter sp. CHRR-16]